MTLLANPRMTPKANPKMTLRMIAAAAVLGLSVPTGVAHADAGLAKSKNCTACHAVDKKLIGPAFKAVAAKYKTDKGAAANLAKKVQAGGKGVWGQVPMPANPQVNAEEAATLVKWILAM